jgi:hypothetical protein
MPPSLLHAPVRLCGNMLRKPLHYFHLLQTQNQLHDPSNIGITSVRNKVFFGARFYCALLTLHVSAPFAGHLQVVRKHKNI